MAEIQTPKRHNTGGQPNVLHLIREVRVFVTRSTDGAGDMGIHILAYLGKDPQGNPVVVTLKNPEEMSKMKKPPILLEKAVAAAIAEYEEVPQDEVTGDLEIEDEPG